MGGKESKQFPITTEEASKRVTEVEKRRLQDAFRRLTTSSGLISRQLFIREVIGDGLPLSLAEQIYNLCNGGINNNSNGNGVHLSASSKGLNFREVLTFLVLITRGTRDEKIKFIYGLLASDGGASIDKADMIRHVKDWENGYVPEAVILLFSDGRDKINFEEFVKWIDVPANAECLGVSRWLMSPNPNLSLVNKMDTPTFYQTLAGVTHLEEHEIVELEKRFWSLASNSSSNQIDISAIRQLISPPLPNILVKPFFSALDENEDGHIDFKELSCGVSAACRGPEMERQKFCFKIFDQDKDGLLNKAEVLTMIQCMVEVHNQTLAEPNRQYPDFETKSEEILEGKENLSIEDYLVWTAKNKDLPGSFAKMIYQLCHIVLGLQPLNRQAEGEIVRGWLDREEKAPLAAGQTWYLLNIDWWHYWNNYVSNETIPKKIAISKIDTNDPTSNGTTATSNNQISTENNLRPASTISSTNSIVEELTNSLTPKSSPHISRKNSSATQANNRPGLIDNSNLIQTPSHKVTSLTGEGGKLKPSLRLIRGKDFELIPERLWRALIHWYGGAPAVRRQVIRNSQGVVELELHPLSIKLLKHQTVPRQANPVPTVVGGYSAAAIHATGATYSGFGNSPPTTTRRYHAHQASFSRRTTIGQIEEFLCQKFSTKLEDMRLWHFKDDNHMKLLMDPGVVLEELGIKDEDSILSEIRSRDGTWPEEISSLTNDRRIAGTSPLNSAVQNIPGITGLNNLGNTCYMNAALQCVSNTKILAQYFQKNCHLHELNRDNPLGFHGHVAKRYGDLVRDMWAASTNKTIAPIKMRWTISRYSQNFSGFQQQDSQELLAFLLDGLHEDLNRVVNKPYDELKDSDGRPDDVVAQEAWENHVRRNKSVIVDLFHGQLKSKVTCKVCGHESVKFDPFTFLSLPLPMESSIHLEVIVIRQDGSVPVKYGLTLDMEARYSDIKPILSKLSRLPVENLILVDIVQSQFRVSTSSEEQKLKGLNGSCLFAYEFQPINRGIIVGVQQRSSQSSVNKGPQQTLSEIQRGMVAQHHEDSRGLKKGPNSCDTNNTNQVVRNSSEYGNNNKKNDANNEDELSKLEELKFSPSNESNEVNDSEKKDISTAVASSSTASSMTSTASPTIPNNAQLNSTSSHSRQSSQCSTSSDMTSRSMPINVGLGDCHRGLLVGLHRKMMPQEVYFLATEKYRPMLFGLPLIIPCSESSTHQDLYKNVWTQVNRLVSPLPPRDSTQNHATDCDDSLGYEYPFVLKVVQFGGSWCAWCPWHRFCRGCELPCTNDEFSFAASYIAIDWDPTALHLRYLAVQEKAFIEDPSVEASLKAATEPITLKKCLEDFTRQEELGEDEKYYCSSCKGLQLASKKLQIWRLPPVLIVHLKRFHFLNGRWIKSHKIVDFPVHQLDPTDYLAAIPQQTICRHKELLLNGELTGASRTRRTSAMFKNCNGTIKEASEGESSNMESVEDDEELLDEFDHEKPIVNGLHDSLDDSAVGRSVDTSIGFVTSMEDEEEVFEENRNDENTNSDGSDQVVQKCHKIGIEKGAIFSPTAERRRSRQQSTSLMRHPIEDDNLKDFHEHRLIGGKDSFDMSYEMYSMVCHSGVLGGGHYISYSKSNSGKWYCLNDSTCKEVAEESIDKSTAYLLFYEREGLSISDYLPRFDSQLPLDTKDLEEELEVEFKKHCNLM